MSAKEDQKFEITTAFTGDGHEHEQSAVAKSGLEEGPNEVADSTEDGMNQSDDDLSMIEILRKENQQLRQAFREVSARQEILEEFIEVEHEEHFKKFLKNRERLVHALGYSIPDDGKRNSKSEEMIELHKIVKVQAKRRATRQPHIPDPKMEALRLHINPDGTVGRRPLKRCHKCHDESHEMRECPYKYEASRTPEVKAMIHERYLRLKEIEGKDPLLSKSYKRKHYKISDKKYPKKSRKEKSS